MNPEQSDYKELPVVAPAGRENSLRSIASGSTKLIMHYKTQTNPKLELLFLQFQIFSNAWNCQFQKLHQTLKLSVSKSTPHSETVCFKTSPHFWNTLFQNFISIWNWSYQAPIRPVSEPDTTCFAVRYWPYRNTKTPPLRLEGARGRWQSQHGTIFEKLVACAQNSKKLVQKIIKGCTFLVVLHSSYNFLIQFFVNFNFVDPLAMLLETPSVS